MIEIRPEPQTLLFSYKNESRESRNTKDEFDRFLQEFHKIDCHASLQGFFWMLFFCSQCLFNSRLHRFFNSKKNFTQILIIA